MRQRKVRHESERIHIGHGRRIGLMFLGFLVFLTETARPDTIWTGLDPATDNWSSGTNWTGLAAPLPADFVTFRAADSGNQSIVDVPFTIAGLQYGGESTHTTNFAPGGSLQVEGPLFVGRSAADGDATVTWNGPGSVRIGTESSPQPFYVGFNDTAAGDNVTLFTVDGPAVEMHLSEMDIGYDVGGGAGTATGTLRWNNATAIDATNVFIGRGPNATGIVEVPVGGTLRLGTETDPVGDMLLGYNTGAGTTSGTLNASAANSTFEAYVNGRLYLGAREWAGDATGTLTLGGNSTLHVGLPTDLADLVIGLGNSTFSGTATGLLDATRGVADLHLDNLNVGWNAGGDGSVTGTLRWNQANPIDATNVYIGVGPNATGILEVPMGGTLRLGTTADPANLDIGHNYGGFGSTVGLLDATGAVAELHLNELNIGRNTSATGSAIGTLRWNQENPIIATMVYIGRDTNATGIVEVPAGGTLRLGTAEDPVWTLLLGYNSSRGLAYANLDFSVTDPTFEAYVNGSIMLGVQTGHGGAAGTLVLGDNSTLHVGFPGEPANLMIGYNTHGYRGAAGLLDATHGVMDLHLDRLDVGLDPTLGVVSPVTGTFTTGNGSTVQANTVYVGMGPDGAGTVNLTGGSFSADSVNLGEYGTFHFTGGRMSVNTFNTYAGVGTLLQEGGILAPGASPGISIINGNYEMDAGLLEIELFGTATGSEYDQLLVNGSIDLDGGALDLILGFAPSDGMEFLIVQNDGTDAILGEFAGWTQGAWLSEMYLGLPYQFSIDYFGGTGNDVVLRLESPTPTVIPAPGAAALVLFGAGIIAARRRRT